MALSTTAGASMSILEWSALFWRGVGARQQANSKSRHFARSKNSGEIPSHSCGSKEGAIEQGIPASQGTLGAANSGEGTSPATPFPEITEKMYRHNPTLPYEVQLPYQTFRFSNEPNSEVASAAPEVVFDECLAAHRFHDAHAVAANCLSRDENSETLTLIGQACWELRQTTAAREFLAKAEASGADSARFHAVYSQSLRGTSEFAASLKHARRATELDPGNSAAWQGLAIATFLNGSQSEALAILDEAVEKLGSKPELKKSRTLISSFFKPEKLDQALFATAVEFDGALEHRPISVDHPFVIQDIELTNHCPMKCVMCPRTHNMTRSLGHMSFETFRRIMDQWAAFDPTFGGTDVVWFHHYGESLVHPEFDRFIRYGRKKGAPVGLSINPIMLSKPISERLIEAEPHTLWIALDGHDDQTFHAIRGVPNAYEKSKANALRFAKMKAERNPDTHLEVIMINFPANKASPRSRNSGRTSKALINSNQSHLRLGMVLSTISIV